MPKPKKRDRQQERQRIRQDKFLKAIAKWPIVSWACGQAGVTRKTISIWDQNPEFNARYEEAFERGKGLYEQKTMKKGLGDAPQLAKLHLIRLDRDAYGQKVEIDIKNDPRILALMDNVNRGVIMLIREFIPKEKAGEAFGKFRAILGGPSESIAGEITTPVGSGVPEPSGDRELPAPQAG